MEVSFLHRHLNILQLCLGYSIWFHVQVVELDYNRGGFEGESVLYKNLCNAVLNNVELLWIRLETCGGRCPGAFWKSRLLMGLTKESIDISANNSI